MRKDQPFKKATLNFIGKVLMSLVSLIGAVLMSIGAISILNNYCWVSDDMEIIIFVIGVIMLFAGMLSIYYQQQQESKEDK